MKFQGAKTITTKESICYSLIAFTAIIISIGLWFFPLISDDLFSVIYFKDTFLHGDAFDLNVYYTNIKQIFETNHFRLPNLLMPVIILLPKWIPALISCISIFYILRTGSQLGNFNCSWKGMTIFASGFIFLFPWWDQLYLVSFQAPYLWGSALSLILLKSILTHKRHSVVLLFIGSVLLGFWLEAYAGVILGACICLMIFFLNHRNRYIVAVSIGLSCGILIDALPLILQCKWTRWAFFEERMILIYPFLFVNLLYVVLSALMARKHVSAVLTPINLTLLEISIASTVLTIYFKTGARINGLGAICSLIGIIYLIRQIKFGRNGVVGFISVTAGLLAACHMIAVDILSYRLNEETKYVLERYQLYSERPVFAPLTFREDASLLALQKPYFDWFAHEKTLGVFNKIYGKGNLQLEVVPAQLRDFSLHEAEKIAGEANIFYYKGYLVTTNPDSHWHNVDFGGGLKPHYFHTVVFKEEGNTQYAWMHLDYASIEVVISPRPHRID